MKEFEEWIASERGKQCATFPIDGGVQYLRNRLWWAYMAGYEQKCREVEKAAQSPPNSTGVE